MTKAWENIRKRPGMYFGTPSITALRHFIEGWSSAVHKYGITDDELPIPLDFNDWVAYCEHCQPTTAGWSWILLDRRGTEEAALNAFFALLEAYESRVPCEFGFIDSHTVEFHRGTDPGAMTFFRYTGRLSFITYGDAPGFFTRFEAEGYTPPQRYHDDLPEWLRDHKSLAAKMTITNQAIYDRLLSYRNP